MYSRSFIADNARVTGESPTRAYLRQFFLSEGYTPQWFDNDLSRQARGIDIELYKDGKTIYIDEKQRTKDFPDFLIEYSSGRAQGQMSKQLDIDFIMHVTPLRIVFISWPKLVKFWTASKEELFDKYSVKRTYNSHPQGDYNTCALIVPLTELASISTTHWR